MFFNKPKSAKPTLTPSVQGQRPGDGGQRAKYPKLYISAPIDIAQEQGDHLFTGRLVYFDVHSMHLERLPGELTLPTLAEGTRIRMRGYSDTMEPFEMTGTVRTSTRMFLGISELDLATDNIRRAHHRQPINLPAEVYALEGRHKDTPQECTLVNISMNGACIASKHAYAMDQKIRLRVELYKKAGHMSFVSQIIRLRALPDESYEYGLLFEQLTHEKMRYLQEDIQEVQDQAKRNALK